MAETDAVLRRYPPGLAVLLGFAVVARAVGGAVAVLSPLIVAIAFGVVVSNTVGVPDWAAEGVGTHKLFLETGIVLLGVRLTFGDLVETGTVVVLLAAAVVLLGVVYLELVARLFFDVERRARSLLAAGTSVCGVSAVIAVAGAIDADELNVTYAVATILLFDAVTLVVVPPLAGPLGLTDRLFGVWAGLTLFSTGPTAAVGFSVSETAGQWATITKLVRNSFIGVLAVGYAVVYATAGTESTSPREIWTQFPKFLLGFLAVVFIANTGVLSAESIALVGTVRDWLFTVAFVGLGFEIALRRLRDVGVKPVVLVGIHLLTVGTLTFFAVESLL